MKIPFFMFFTVMFCISFGTNAFATQYIPISNTTKQPTFEITEIQMYYDSFDNIITDDNAIALHKKLENGEKIKTVREKNVISEEAKYFVNRPRDVIKGTVISEGNNCYIDVNHGGYTKIEVRVDDVYRGDLKQNEIITIMEPYYSYYSEKQNTIYEIFTGLYKKSIPEKQYLFLLQGYGKGLYRLYGEDYGRYVAPPDNHTIAVQEMTAEQCDIAQGDITKYKQCYNEVLQKYVYQNDKNENVLIPVSEFVETAKNIDDIARYSEYIVKAKVLYSKNVLLRYLSSYTQTEIQITKVYQGNINVGDVLTLEEPYCTLSDGRQIQQRGYMPSSPDKEYIFFVKKQHDGSYGCSILGRYSFDENEQLVNENAEVDDLKLYDKLKQQVYDIYKNIP